jgi:hypothetical protein
MTELWDSRQHVRTWARKQRTLLGTDWLELIRLEILITCCSGLQSAQISKSAIVTCSVQQLQLTIPIPSTATLSSDNIIYRNLSHKIVKYGHDFLTHNGHSLYCSRRLMTSALNPTLLCAWRMYCWHAICNVSEYFFYWRLCVSCYS